MAIVAALVWGAAPTQADAATWRAKECRYQTLDGRLGWVPKEVVATIRCFAPRFGISTETALNIGQHESGFHAEVGSTYCGVYQHSSRYVMDRIYGAEQRWPHLRWMGHSCYNARSNILAAFHLVKATGGWEAGWCRWTAYC